MHPKMVRTIYWKDVRDAIRDGRILVAILLPLALGVFYNLVLQKEPARPRIVVAYAAAGQTKLPELLMSALGESVDVQLEQVGDQTAVSQRVASQDATLGLFIPGGFDQAIADGASPQLLVIRRTDSQFGADFVSSALTGALLQLAGRNPVATVQVAAVSPTDRGQNIFQLLGPAPYFVITTCVLLTAMIALFAVPVMLAEEAEKKTLDALVMIASYTDVIIAKALVGLSYTVVALGLLFGLTRAAPQDVWGFIAAIFPLSLALIGFGLLLGGLFRSATQLNTWSSFILLPVVAPIFVVGLPLPEPVRIALLFVPTSQGTRLAINAMTGEHFFSGSWLAYLVIVTWGALAFALLQWRLSRYDA